MKIRSYSELSQIESFEDRFDYLSLDGSVGEQTFGFERWRNQAFYLSSEWGLARRTVIIRDNGCDLGVPGYDVQFGLLVHHMNPLTVQDIEAGEDWIIDPEFLICTSKRTHNAIHYGDASLLPRPHVERQPGDTTLW
jgi:hypothetical protein